MCPSLPSVPRNQDSQGCQGYQQVRRDLDFPSLLACLSLQERLGLQGIPGVRGILALLSDLYHLQMLRRWDVLESIGVVHRSSSPSPHPRIPPPPPPPPPPPLFLHILCDLTILCWGPGGSRAPGLSGGSFLARITVLAGLAWVSRGTRNTRWARGAWGTLRTRGASRASKRCKVVVLSFSSHFTCHIK